MRILSWVQSKISGKNEKKKPHGGCAGSARYPSIDDSRKEEFSDWPNGLLAIGTFGNGVMGDSQRYGSSVSSSSSQDFTTEEVSKLQNELTMLLALKTKFGSCESGIDSEKTNLPLDKFLNCPSSLEIDRGGSQKFNHELEIGEDGNLSPTTRIILSRAKDVLAESRGAINKKSFSFLLKKMFVCKGGFSPAPSLRDPLQESTMEKLLRIILNKKICPQNPAPLSAKKYLENKPVGGSDIEDENHDMHEKADDGCRWVKTDSEYIVLEI